MKKTLLITFGVLIILIILAVWVYLLMYGKPKGSAEIFAQFGFGDDKGAAPVIIPTPPTEENAPPTEEPRKRLRQLTTKPVAGAGFVGSSTIRYVEQGTGHVYEIDLTSLQETLISGTTLPQTTSAVFSQDGAYVAITTFSQDGTETIVGTVVSDVHRGGELDGVALPKDAREIAFDATLPTLYYMLKNASGANGYAYNIQTEKSTEIFAIPLRDIRVLWGNPLYVYTTPTIHQVGHVYKIGAKNALEYVTHGERGLVILKHATGVIGTYFEGATHSNWYAPAGLTVTQSVPLIPEKCVADPLDPKTYFCSVPQDMGDGTFPDEWYMGTASYSDILWRVQTDASDALVLLDLEKESGQIIDVYKIGIDYLGIRLYLVNKNDNTLWLYDRSVH